MSDKKGIIQEFRNEVTGSSWYSLQPLDWDVLRYIASRGMVTKTNVTNRFEIPDHSAGYRLGKLRKQGLVIMRPVMDNTRFYQYCVTDRAIDVFDHYHMDVKISARRFKV